MKISIKTRVAALAVAIASVASVVAFPITASAYSPWIAGYQGGNLYACRRGSYITVTLRSTAYYSSASANGVGMGTYWYSSSTRTVYGSSVSGHVNGASYYAAGYILPSC